jgi:hypothetical protein
LCGKLKKIVYATAHRAVPKQKKINKPHRNNCYPFHCYHLLQPLLLQLPIPLQCHLLRPAVEERPRQVQHSTAFLAAAAAFIWLVFFLGHGSRPCYNRLQPFARKAVYSEGVILEAWSSSRAMRDSITAVAMSR